jgi:hypothetical protein
VPPEEFYPQAFTDLSEKVLRQLVDDFPDLILIGGWASWIRIGIMRSHDIDMIVGPELRRQIEDKYGEMSVSTHIAGRKWSADYEGIHLDIYVPYQSRLGNRLKLAVEGLLPYAETVDGWRLLEIPAHLATKFAALLDRPESQPGEKDRQEIWNLLQQEVSAEAVAKVLGIAQAERAETVARVREVFELLEDLPLKRAERQRLRELGMRFQAAAEEALSIGDA